MKRLWGKEEEEEEKEEEEEEPSLTPFFTRMGKERAKGK